MNKNEGTHKKMKKNQWIIILIIAVLVVAIIGVILWIVLPANFNQTQDDFYIINEEGVSVETKIRPITSEDTDSTNHPYQLAKDEKNMLTAKKQSQITITTDVNQGRKLTNITNVQLLIYKSEENTEKVSSTKNERSIIFDAPETEGKYYYCLTIEYQNGKKADYIFELNIESSIENLADINQIMETYKGKLIGDNVSVVGLVDSLENIKPTKLTFEKREFAIDSNALVLTINYTISNDSDLLDVMTLDVWAKQTTVPVLFLLNNCNKVVMNIYNKNGDIVFIRNAEKTIIKEQFKNMTERESILKVFEEENE